MNRLIIPIIFLIAGLLTSCGSSVRVFHDFDRSVDFSQYASYNFLDWTKGNLNSINEMERERLRIAIANELESRGLTFSPDGADVSVQIIVYHRENKRSSYGSPYPYYNPYYMSPRLYNYMERALSVDIYDNSFKKHVWHSAAVGELEYDPEKRSEQMPDVVNQIFKDFPISKSI